MKRKYWLQLLVFAVLVNIGSAVADDGFYVVAVGGGVGTKITRVPYIISNPGFYYLAGNLTYSGSDNAITVNSNDVTIDLMGFSLSTATGQSGIFASYLYSNVEIRNGTVRGFSLDGVSLGGGKSRVLNIRAFANQSHGIIVDGNGNQIRGCTACNTTRGIFIAGGTLSGCTASDNSVYGIFCSGAASILNNVANNNTGHNFWFSSGSQKVLVDRNAADGLNPNYYITNTSTGVTITSNNVGTP